jgi:hypothetical protein
MTSGWTSEWFYHPEINRTIAELFENYAKYVLFDCRSVITVSQQNNWRVDINLNIINLMKDLCVGIHYQLCHLTMILTFGVITAPIIYYKLFILKSSPSMIYYEINKINLLTSTDKIVYVQSGWQKLQHLSILRRYARIRFF